MYDKTFQAPYFLPKDLKLEYLEFSIYSHTRDFEKSSEKVEILRNFYDKSGCYDHIVPLHLIKQANKLHFLNCLEFDKLFDAKECFNFLDEDTVTDLTILLKARQEAQKTLKIELEERVSEDIEELDTAASALEASSLPLRLVRVREYKEYKEGNLLDYDTAKRLISDSSTSPSQWNRCIDFLKKSISDENPESWRYNDKDYDCAHGVINLRQSEGFFAHNYVYIDTKVLSGLDSVTANQFISAASKVTTRNSGQNGLKPINDNVEIKINGDSRLVADLKLINGYGECLYLFNSPPKNHAAVLKQKTCEVVHVDIVRHHLSIEEKIAQILSGEDSMSGFSEASSLVHEASFLGEAPGPSDA